MWVLFAFGSAGFAGITAVLAKIGISRTNSNLATAIRTIVVLLAAWGMTVLVGSTATITHLTPKTWIFLILSGLATGGSWLCYFRALQLGDVNRVAPVDRSSLVLTVIIAVIFLGETQHLATTLTGVALIALGTALMVGRLHLTGTPKSRAWFVYAAASAVLAAVTSILGKVGIAGVESNLGTAIRTAVVLVMAWLVVGVTNTAAGIATIPRRDLLFIILSGLATAGSWLCFYRALQTGPASVVAPIDKLSILVTVGFSWLVLHERLSRTAAAGLALITAGTLVMLL